MEIFTELVKNLTIVIILATVLELFLPNGKMKPFVQIIVGLFVMITILNPLLSFVKGDWSTSLQVWAQQGDIGSLESILEKGETLTQAQMEIQLKSVAGLSSGVEVLDSNISFDNSGQIERIHLTLGTQASQPQEEVIRPVEINIVSEKEGESIKVSGSNEVAEGVNEARYANIKEIVASFYGISPELVEITTQN